MVILGIAGSLACGKTSAISYLKKVYDFSIISLSNEEFFQDNLNDSSDLKEKLQLMLQKLLENREKHYIISPITRFEELEVFRTTCNFFLLAIDCPLQLRYRNYVKKYGKPKTQLPGFISMDDSLRFSNNLSQIILTADRIIQNISNLEDFYSQLRMLDILNFNHIRPNIEIYYSRMAEMISSRSGCIRHKAGCIVTSRNRIVSSGYSGIPKGRVQCVDGGCESCFADTETECMCQHAEMNAIIEGKFHKVRGSVVYVNIFPCFRCAQGLIQARISELIYSKKETIKEEIKNYLVSAGIQVKFVSVVV